MIYIPFLTQSESIILEKKNFQVFLIAKEFRLVLCLKQQILE